MAKYGRSNDLAKFGRTIELVQNNGKNRSKKTLTICLFSHDGKRDPNLDRPQTVAEIRNRPVSRRPRTSTARSNKVLKHVIGEPKFHNRERQSYKKLKKNFKMVQSF